MGRRAGVQTCAEPRPQRCTLPQREKLLSHLHWRPASRQGLGCCQAEGSLSPRTCCIPSPFFQDSESWVSVQSPAAPDKASQTHGQLSRGGGKAFHGLGIRILGNGVGRLGDPD